MARSKTNTSILPARIAIGYARVSSEGQRTDGNSIENQIDSIKQYAEKNGLKLIDTIEEAKSASKIKSNLNLDLLTDRPEFQKILDRAKKHEFTDLIISYRDRLARDFYESIIIKSLLIKSKVTIHYASTAEKLSAENEYIEKFTDLVFSNIAMLEAGLIGLRAKSGQKVNIQHGYYAGGPLPYGYNLTDAHEKNKKTYIKDNSKEIVIKRIFALYNLRFSYSEIINILKKEFSAETKISFTKSTLSQIINNEVYTGCMIWNRRSKHQLGENDITLRSNEKEDMKIVPSSLYNKVLEIKSLKTGDNYLAYKSNFILKGKLICGSCGKAFKAKNNGKGKKNVYYCTCENEKPKSSKTICSITNPLEALEFEKQKKSKTRWSITIPQEALEKYVFDLIYKNLKILLNDYQTLGIYYNLYSRLIEEEKSNASKYISTVRNEINQIENTIDDAKSIFSNMLTLKKEDNVLYGEIFFEAIRNTISLVEIRKKELEKQNTETRKIERLKVMTLKEFALKFKKILSTLNEVNSLETKEFSPPLSTIKLKRILIEDIIDKIVVNPGIYGESLSIYLKFHDISAAHNFEFLKTCPINNILSI